MPLSVNNVNLTISDVKDITSGRLAVNFENSQGDLKDGAISMNGETFTVWQAPLALLRLLGRL